MRPGRGTSARIGGRRGRMRRLFSRMGVRDRLLLAVLGTVAVALVTMTVAFNLLLDASLTSDVDERLQTDGPGREPHDQHLAERPGELAQAQRVTSRSWARRYGSSWAASPTQRARRSIR